MKTMLPLAAVLALAAAPALGQATLAARAVALNGGVQIFWQEPEPQPYYFLIERMPSGRGFPKHVNPNYAVEESFTDGSAKSGAHYRYRVCSAYSPRGSQLVCTKWFAPNSPG
jgi:hypothetical protein